MDNFNLKKYISENRLLKEEPLPENFLKKLFGKQDKYPPMPLPTSSTSSKEIEDKTVGHITVSGTFDGLRTIGKDVGDLRYDARGKDGQIIETTREGNRIISLVKETVDYVGRPGYVGVSITLPKGNNQRPEDFKMELNKQMNKLTRGENISGKSFRGIGELNISEVDKTIKLM